MTDREVVWTGHLIHRWSKWLDMEVTTTVKRQDATGNEYTRMERLEVRKYRVCEICGAEQEGR